MPEEFIYYTSNFTDWNCTKTIKMPDLYPFDTSKKLNICYCNLYKYNCLIFLGIIITYMRDYLENETLNGYLKKGFNGSKCDYWDILNITTNLFDFYLFRTEDKINYHKNRFFEFKTHYIHPNENKS